MTGTQGSLVDRAEWLAKGYIQGQRDMLVKLLEHRFPTDLPDDIRTQIAHASPTVIENLGEVVLTAPDLHSVIAAAVNSSAS